jgi:hypothetical protein
LTVTTTARVLSFGLAAAYVADWHVRHDRHPIHPIKESA